MDKEKAVQGIGVYAEFARNGATTQVILVPDGLTSEDSKVGATIIRRTVTEHTPKKQWKFSRLPDAAVTDNTVADDDKERYSEDRLRYAASLFDQLIRGEWTIVKKPILVEVSKKDYDNIYLSKTPTKMVYRISQSRVALDFPEDLIQTTSA